jgi:Ca2+-binding EF-hand superfamily protein
MAQRVKKNQNLSDRQKTAKKTEEVERFKKSLTSEQIELYRKHFDLFDLNGDGVISARELRKVSRKMGYRLDDSQIEVSKFLILPQIHGLVGEHSML